MNRLDARVKSIRSMENLSIVSFSFYKQTLQMMSLGLSSEVKEDSLVVLNVKATSIALAKNLKGSISTPNQIECRVQSVDDGELLTSVVLEIDDARLECIITKEASLLMNIQEKDEVLALIKESDLSILEVKE